MRFALPWTLPSPTGTQASRVVALPAWRVLSYERTVREGRSRAGWQRRTSDAPAPARAPYIPLPERSRRRASVPGAGRAR
ncbi:hypothetical protein PsYK624_151790 [Phanerochaete sordida]|uniref:Uncharacterized protein n=1 Tax=Phanerochaete sordida TaxID=48140 RepID=A0A9P3GQD0_9APHY|nr:hypothetical protein PsYK624_151790 [Phanerochaete sordida]